MTEVQRQNVDLVRRVNELGGSSADMGALVERFDEFFRPDANWKPRMMGFGRDAYVGRDGIRQYVDEMQETTDEVDFEIAELRPVGDEHVLLLGRLHLLGKGSRVPLDMEWAILWGFEAGLIRSGVAFNSHTEAEAEADRIGGGGADA